MIDEYRKRELDKLVGELTSLVERNNAVVARIKAELPLLLLAAVTAGFVAGVIVCRFAQYG